MTQPGYCDRPLLVVIVASIVCSLVAAVAMVGWTMNLETIGAGLFLPVLIVPAFCGHALATERPRTRRWRHLIYLALGLPIPIYLLWVVLFPSPGARADGVPDWCLAFLIPLVAATLAGWVTLEVLERRRRGRA